MIFKELRLFGLKTIDSTRFLCGLLIRDHNLIIYPERDKQYFVIKNYLFSKATYLFNAQNGKLAQKRFEMFNHTLQGLECYEIWNTPVKENELLKCREKFYESIKLLEKLNESEISTFLLTSNIDYKSFEIIIQYKDKIFEMAVLLKCSPKEVLNALRKHRFLLKSKLTTLQKKIAIVTGSGVDIADLRRDLCVLSYGIEKLQSNVEKVKSLNLPIKCWMLRYDESSLNTIWETREKNKAAMFPFKNSREYLRNRLEMNDNQLISFSKKYPAVLKVKTAKLRGVLDYLLSEGFTTDQIYCTPRILCHSIFTIQNRLRMLREREYEPRTLSLLCMSVKAFEIYLQKVEKTNQFSEKT